MSTSSYKDIYAYLIFIIIFERLRRVDFEIHKFDHQVRIAIDETSPPTKKIINHKYNIHIKSKI
jgi:hypothetical protein